MYRKRKLCLPFLALFLIAYSIFFLKSFVFLLLLPAADTDLPCEHDRPLRVFMYDLPRKFNVGMFDRHASPESDPDTGSKLPPWPAKLDGIKRQHSIEYWLMASLLHDGGGTDAEAVRVYNPESADVFFVPYFSAQSFFTHGFNATDRQNVIDRKLQLELIEFLHGSKYWQRSEGRDHVIPMTLPKGFSYTSQQVNASILIIVDFELYPRNMANLRKDVVSPYVHIVESFSDDDTPNPFESRTTLLFFRGLTIRQNEGQVRPKLARILAGHKDVRFFESIPTNENIIMATQEMRLSKFCLSPAGNTPSSCRLFDAIVSHCVPVIVSDHIELPYEQELDYSEFSIFFSIEEALQPNYMVNKLRQIPRAKWIEMWKRLKEISHHFEFQYPPKKEDAVNMIWRQVKHKLPAVRLALHRSQRLKIPDWWRRKR